MVNIIVELSKYLMIILMTSYTFLCFSIFGYQDPDKKKSSANAGFTAGTPWIDVNPNYRKINVREAQADPDSILHFYRKLLALRQRLEALRSGTFRLLLPEHPQLLAYERACGEERIRVCSKRYCL